jgi:hypothetical protein
VSFAHHRVGVDPIQLVVWPRNETVDCHLHLQNYFAHLNPPLFKYLDIIARQGDACPLFPGKRYEG